MKNFRTIVYKAENDLIDTIKEFESYLSYEKRYYLNQDNERFKKMILDKNDEFGYVPIQKNDNDLEKIIIDKEMKKILYEMLKLELTGQQFKCIELYYSKNLTQEETAEELNIDRTTVAFHLKDAIGKIKNNKFYEYLI
jgi:RNA polymerase sigma factor (sigma-70 family)